MISGDIRACMVRSTAALRQPVLKIGLLRKHTVIICHDNEEYYGQQFSSSPILPRNPNMNELDPYSACPPTNSVHNFLPCGDHLHYLSHKASHSILGLHKFVF